MIKISLLCLCFFFPATFWGLVVHTIDTGHPLKVKFSKSHQNRIVVEDTFIKKVIAPQSSFSIQIEKESGQVFVHAVTDPQKPVVLSVITANGNVQDIEITLEERSSEVVLLKEPDLLSLENDQSLVQQKPSIKIISAIQKILANKLPKGFTRTEIGEGDAKPEQNKDLYLIPIRIFEDAYTIITEYEAFNQDQQTISIEESQLAEKNTIWIFVKNPVILSGKSTPIYICRRK